LALVRHRQTARRAALLLAAAHLGACQFNPVGAAGQNDSGVIEPDADVDPDPDAPPEPPIDASPPDGMPPEPSAHLLLTEVKTQPSAAEFIEIFNPMTVEIPLDDYYLSDDPLYARVAEFTPPAEPTVQNQDAILRFPAGAAIQPGQVLVVAMNEQGFRDAFGTDADFAVAPAIAQMVPAMVRIADAPQSMQLIDIGEPVILFTWDGLRDLVTDVDIVLIGNVQPPLGDDDALPNKTGLAVDGPDEGPRALTYAPDGASMMSMTFRAGVGGSYKRIAPEGSEEPRDTSNGIAGHDETSEDTRTTWSQTDSAPTPGQVPAELTD
jgi:hypothetical protein